MVKNKVQNDKVKPDDEISNEDLDKVAGGILTGSQTKTGHGQGKSYPNADGWITEKS